VVGAERAGFQPSSVNSPERAGVLHERDLLFLDSDQTICYKIATYLGLRGPDYMVGSNRLRIPTRKKHCRPRVRHTTGAVQ
jgi:hypothetical protein